MIDGRGDPNTVPAYERALATIYPVAYRLKLLSKRDLGRDYGVPPLEALWWADDPEAFTTERDKSRWSWTVLSLVPDWIEPAHLEEVTEGVARRGAAPALDDLRVEVLDEGLCVQTLHVGPYEMEGPVIAALHDHATSEGLRLRGRHHEIYLGDARRSRPENLRTILRQPVERTQR